MNIWLEVISVLLLRSTDLARVHKVVARRTWHTTYKSWEPNRYHSIKWTGCSLMGRERLLPRWLCSIWKETWLQPERQQRKPFVSSETHVENACTLKKVFHFAPILVQHESLKKVSLVLIFTPFWPRVTENDRIPPLQYQVYPAPKQ